MTKDRKNEGFTKEKSSTGVEVKRLQTKLEAKFESESVAIDDETSLDLEKVMIEEEMDITCKFREDSFQAIFWKCQKGSLG